MKIGFDAKRAFTNRSGLGNYSRSIISLMAEHYPDNEYLLYTPKIGPGIFPPQPHAKIITPSSLLAKAFPAAWRSFGLSYSLEKEMPDLFHGLSNELPFGISKSGIRTIVTIHDLIFLRLPKLYPFMDRQVYEAKFRNACRVADTIIAVSEATRNDIIHYFKADTDKVKVVYQSCSQVFRLKASEDEKKVVISKYALPDEFILSVGTLEERKNALGLLKAVYDQGISMPVVLAGRATPYVNELTAFIAQHKMEQQVFLLHCVQSYELPALYQLASLFVFPSLFEGFGIPILESLFSGTPVITSTGSCFAETGGNAARYADPSNREELGVLIKKVLTDSELRSLMIAKGYEHSLKFTGEQIAKGMMELYHEILA